MTSSATGRLVVTAMLAAVAVLVAPATPATAATPRHLYNINSKLCLTARAGSGERPVVQTTCDFNQNDGYWPDQYWDLNAPGQTAVRSTMLQLCVAARGTAETGAVATTCGGWPDQQWVLFNKGGRDGYLMRNVSSNLCLAARGNTESRAVATTCEPIGQYWPDQHWQVF